jgi:hypothetical protein
MAWNEIRQAVHAIANLRARQAVARALNRVLPPLQDEFESALSRGEILELGPSHLEDLEAALAQELDVLG